ncbi:MAG: crossover junction endodeoxyribonuclease RuvC [Pseudomonadota bacterium]|nr:crossover junction endodeoxyribonuclease RuvC [Pseudomonadota bacterium]
MGLILGIDPGGHCTGFGIIEDTLNYVTCGCIRTRSTILSERLLEIYQGLDEIITQYQPTLAAIEQVFVQHNAQSALKLGQVRGVTLLACSQHALTVYEYAPTKIKQAIAGHGRAHKQQIQHMITLLLKLPQTPATDAADALAVAVCHAHSQRL